MEARDVRRCVALADLPLENLELPVGWHIVQHRFYAVDPFAPLKVVGLPDGDPWELFVQDLLQLKNEGSDLCLDLGWVPEADPTGQYELTLIKGTNWDTPVSSFRSTDRKQVVAEIKRILER
jgi:hypothetical protein